MKQKSIKRSTLNVENVKPGAGKMILLPFKPMTRKVKNIVPDEEKNADKDPMKDIMEVKEVTLDAPYEVQLAEVLAIDDGYPYKVGDVVMYTTRFARDFDLFDGTLIASVHDILGKYIISE